ncbi:MAG: hypothetical protein RR649_05935 [Carnobacterium sp.]
MAAPKIDCEIYQIANRLFFVFQTRKKLNSKTTIDMVKTSPKFVIKTKKEVLFSVALATMGLAIKSSNQFIQSAFNWTPKAMIQKRMKHKRLIRKAGL